MVKSKEFYTRLFELEVAFDSDWFIHLRLREGLMEIGLISSSSEMVPQGLQHGAQGMYITLVVYNADEVYNLAIANSLEVFSRPEDTFYGQRRLLLKDPDGVLVDVSSPIQG